jgi:Domain of unknown function (DUF4260)
MITHPGSLLRAEGGIIFVLSLLVYVELHASWILFAVLILAPDLVILGYLSGVRIGASLYNLVHTLVAPLVLVGISVAYKQFWLLLYGLIWTTHIGFDRLLGYGLKYPTTFRDTHLKRLS